MTPPETKGASRPDRKEAVTKRIPGKEARYGTLARPLPSPLTRYLQREGLHLYSHQAEAIERVREGHHTILPSSTASGKTLAFNLAVLEGLWHDPQATALYLYPLKALTQDQWNGLREMERATGLEMGTAIYDGDTPYARRRPIRETSRIVLTNPHALHQYLSWHGKWERFLGHLRYIILDEAHVYRGIFGSNVALLLRRLLRIADRYGTHPQFVLASATMANAREHARTLAGVDFTAVEDDGAPRGTKRFVFWNAALRDRSVHQQTSDLLARHVRAGYQTLCFTLSRKLAELVAQRTQQDHGLGDRVAAYRAGYPPEERRRIERELKAGRLRGLASTNALELGIDIGSLDAVIIAGYPGTVTSTWQMAGRAGRGAAPAVVTFIGFENPLDQYFVKHPQRFFERPHEHAIIDLANHHVVASHLTCAAAELPVETTRDRSWFGAPLDEAVHTLGEQGLLRPTQAGWVHPGGGSPAQRVKLEHLSDRTVRLQASGRTLETMELRRACEEAHPGAVLLHQGETYVVENLDLTRDEGRAVRKNVRYHTEPTKTTRLEVVRVDRRRDTRCGTLHLGRVRVVERVTGYRVKHPRGRTRRHDLDMPPMEFETSAIWWTLPPATAREVQTRDNLVGGLHAAEHALIAMTPYHAMCDRWDVGGLSMPYHPGTERATVFLYDGYPEGIGITEKVHGLFERLAETTYELVRDCGCEEGCPSCIYSPKCGNANEDLDKRSAVRLLRKLTET